MHDTRRAASTERTGRTVRGLMSFGLLLGWVSASAGGCLGAGCDEPPGVRTPGVTGKPGSSAGAPASSASAGSSVAAAADAGAKDGAAAWSNDWPPSEPFRSEERFDLVIRGGEVIDGTGRPRVRADVLVDDGRVAHVGAVDEAIAVDQTVDASELVVAPGFIDAHSHGVPLGKGRGFIAQGVTTICLGQDGRSASDDRIRDWVARLSHKRLALNLLPFVGHGTVRALAGVGHRKNPSDEQLDEMARVVAEEMQAGAWGLSTGLEYYPGRFATLAELVAIAKPVAEHDGMVMSHMRSEDDDKIEAALDELIAQGAGSGARVHVSHIKVVYGHGAERAEQILARMQAAREKGVSLTADIYPYNASYTTISIVFPDYAQSRSTFKQVVAKRRAELAAYLRKRITQRGGPEATLFGSPPWDGKTLATVASELGKPFEDVLIDDVGPGGATAAYFVMDDALQSRLLVDRHVMISSDGASHSRHPRGRGSFAKVLSEHVRKRKALSLEEAIRKMTGLTAKTLGLDRLKRGCLRAGCSADLVAFAPAEVRDRATYQHPSRLAEGMRWVLINGQAVRAKNKFTQAKPGRVLRRPK